MIENMVLKNLTQEQTDNQKNYCFDILERLTDEQHLLTNIIICEKRRNFRSELRTKCQSKQSQTPIFRRMKIAQIGKSKLKAKLMVFFDVKGVIMIEGQPVQQKYYREILIKMREGAGKKKQDLWKKDPWILHKNNASFCEIR